MDARHADVDAERAELAALRRRAYSVDADIDDDPAAIERLAELEERVQRARAVGLGAVASDIPEGGDAAPDVPPDAPPSPSDHTDRRAHTGRGIVVAAAVAALILGGAVVTGRLIAGAGPTAAPDAGGGASAASAAASAPETLLDSLRRDVLAGAEPDNVAGRVIRDELQRYGDAHGWSVWAGPTIDDAVCLVVGEGGNPPSITCGSPAYVTANGLSLVVPAAEADAARGTEPAVVIGQPVRITLLPDLAGIVSEPEPDRQQVH